MIYEQMQTYLMLPVLNIEDNLIAFSVPMLIHVEAVLFVAIFTLQYYLICAFTIDTIANNSVGLHFFHPTDSTNL